MAKSFVNKLNLIQAQRAPQIVSDANLEQNIQDMADAGHFPKGLIAYTQKRFENEDFVAIWGFDTQKQEWVFKRTDKSDGSVLNLRGSRQDIQDGLEFEKALLQRAVNEAIEEAELTDPDYMTGERLECFKWTTETYHGREYKTIAYNGAWNLLQARLLQLGLPITVANLEKAYCDLLDMEPCPLDSFFAKRDATLAREAEAENEGSGPSIPVAETPFENLGPAPEVEARQKADKENRRLSGIATGKSIVVTKEGLATLKRLAIDSRYAREHRQ